MSVEVDPTGAREAVAVHHGPTRLGAAMATVAAFLALVASASSFLGLMIGVLGFLGLVVALFGTGSRRLASLGVGIVFAGIVTTGVMGGDEVLVVIGAVMSILAFDYTQNAFSVGSQLSLETETWRGEAVHAAASLAVGVVSAAFAFAIYLLADGSFAAVGLVFLFLGAVALLWAIRS